MPIHTKFDLARSAHRAFSATMAKYEKARAKSDSFRGGLDRKHTLGVVRPFTSDFIADVEIAARKVLSPAEFVFFKSVFITQMVVPPTIGRSPRYREQLNQISEKLGRGFIARRIFPTDNYFKEIDTRK